MWKCSGSFRNIKIVAYEKVGIAANFRNEVDAKDALIPATRFLCLFQQIFYTVPHNEGGGDGFMEFRDACF